MEVYEYPKINTVFKRGDRGRLILNDWSEDAFEYLKDNEWVWTEKIDGTNMRIIMEEGKVRLAGRHDSSEIPSCILGPMSALYTDESFTNLLSSIFPFRTVILFGEGISGKINKVAGMYANVISSPFILFDIFVSGEECYVNPYTGKCHGTMLSRKSVDEIGEKLGIPVTPVKLRGTIQEAIDLVRAGFNSAWGNWRAEGLVGSPSIRLSDEQGNRIVTKLKWKDFNKI